MLLKIRELAFSKISFIALLILVVLLSGFIKLHLTKKLPKYNADSKSVLYGQESAFQFRYAKMIAKGRQIPDIDYDIQYPEGLDVFSNITLCKEYFVGYTYRILAFLGIGISFEQFAIVFESFFSALVILPLFSICFLITKNKIMALIACLFYISSPFSLMRVVGHFLYENFALLFIFTSLFLYLRSINQDNKKITYLYTILAGTCLVIASISWHFTQFYILVFISSVILAFFLEKDLDLARKILKNLLIVLAILFVGGNVFKILRAISFYRSATMLLFYALLPAYVVFLRKKNKLRSSIVFCISLVLGITLLLFIDRSHLSRYSHVFLLFINKIKFLNSKPLDPGLLPYDARVLWVEAFNSPSIGEIISTFLTLGFFGFWGFFKRLIKPINTNRIKADNILIFIFLSTFVLFLFINRLYVFFGFFLTVFIAYTIPRKAGYYKIYLSSLIICIMFQLYADFAKPKFLFAFSKNSEKNEFNPEGAYKEDLYNIANWIKNFGIEKAPILADIGISPTFHSLTGNPVIMHPKFEDSFIRNKYKQFIDNLYSNNEEDFYNFCKKYKVQYFLYNKKYIFNNSLDSRRYLADKLQLNKESVVMKFHFFPEELKYLKLVYQTSSCRLYHVVNGESGIFKDRVDKHFIEYYYPVYDINIFGQNDTLYFNDTKVKGLLDKLYKYPYMYNQTAMQHAKYGNFQLANKVLLKAVELNPYNSVVYTNIIYNYQTMGQIDIALKFAEKALSVNPNLAINYSNLAALLIEKNRFNEAQNILQKGIELCPWYAELYNTYGVYYTRAGILDKALEMFNKAHFLDPNETDYKNNITIISENIKNKT